jgi:hypothetical protein
MNFISKKGCFKIDTSQLIGNIYSTIGQYLNFEKINSKYLP